MSKELPQLVLDIEKRELGISAGLQDRVIQTYGGLVHMDFASPAVTSVTNASATPSRSPYTPLDPALLPPFYLAYDTEAGGDSGAVHSTVRARWESREPALVEGMAALGGLADQAVECLNSGDYGTLALLMERNFATRLELYGAQVVGAKNLQAVRLGGEMGLACKFTGSGGALLCMRREGGWLGAAEEQGAVEAFKQMGFAFVRVRIPPPPL
ncbi:hypothetical protein B484DRAFT_425310 [Ochromonadaceae sp. CCMP2298]|nr:hypothetical protein B484DRAFT_425310 [Ochromonadaceae sp. CCMP2298]